LPVVDTWHCIIHRIEAIAAATNNELPIAITSIIQIVSCFEPPARQSTKQTVFSQIWSNQLFIHALLLLCTTTVLANLDIRNSSTLLEAVPGNDPEIHRGMKYC
jgi:hypothetical protein